MDEAEKMGWESSDGQEKIYWKLSDAEERYDSRQVGLARARERARSSKEEGAFRVGRRVLDRLPQAMRRSSVKNHTARTEQE